MTVNTFVSGPYRTPESIRRRAKARGARMRGSMGICSDAGPWVVARRRAPGDRPEAGPGGALRGGPLRPARWAPADRGVGPWGPRGGPVLRDTRLAAKQGAARRAHSPI